MTLQSAKSTMWECYRTNDPIPSINKLQHGGGNLHITRLKMHINQIRCINFDFRS